MNTWVNSSFDERGQIVILSTTGKLCTQYCTEWSVQRGGANQPSELEKFCISSSLIAVVQATPKPPHACAIACRIKTSQTVGKAHTYSTTLSVLLKHWIKISICALVFRNAELSYLKTFEKIHIGDLFF